jgi:cytochrome c-type biogenesis protein CcmH/NrfG
MSVLRFLFVLVVFGVLLPLTRAAASPSEMLAAGRVDDAIASLEAQLQKSPGDAASHNYLCRAYYSVSDWDRAIGACEKAVSLEGGNSDYHLWLGRAYGEKAENASPLAAFSLARKLRKQFETAVQLDPRNVDARVDLAEFYMEAPGIVGGGDEKARAQASALLSSAPATAHYVLGRLAEKNKDVSAAQKEYRAAVDAEPANAHNWLNLALFYKHQTRLDQMEQALQRAVTAPSAQNEVIVECAELLLRTGRNPAAAAQLVRRYLASNSPTEKSPLFQAHYVLGTALEKQGDTSGAAHEYRAALALASNFNSARSALDRLSQSTATTRAPGAE